MLKHFNRLSEVALKIKAGKLEAMKFETGFDGIERVIAALHDAAE